MVMIHKYKAWDKIDKMMCDVGFIDFAHERAQLAILTNTPGVAYGTWVREFKDIELRQFTGLKDINDVSIYEGDIISEGNGTSSGVVEYNKDRACFRYRNGLDYIGLYGFCGEVIGNIHENPELLEAGV